MSRVARASCSHVLVCSGDVYGHVQSRPVMVGWCRRKSVVTWSELGLESRLEMTDEIDPVDTVQDGKSKGRIGWRMGDGSTRRKDAVRRIGWLLWRPWTRVPNRQLMEIQLAEVKARIAAWEAEGGCCVVVVVVADVRIVTGMDIRHGGWGMVVGLVVVEKCVGHFVVNWGNRFGSKGAGALL